MNGDNVFTMLAVIPLYALRFVDVFIYFFGVYAVIAIHPFTVVEKVRIGTGLRAFISFLSLLIFVNFFTTLALHT
jgi:hypothetical protein